MSAPGPHLAPPHWFFMHDLPDAGWENGTFQAGCALALGSLLDNATFKYYFAGEEPVPQGATDAEFDETARVQLGIASCGTQTDFAEVSSSAPTEPRKGVQDRARTLKRTASIGTIAPLTAAKPPERSFTFPDLIFVAVRSAPTAECKEPKRSPRSPRGVP